MIPTLAPITVVVRQFNERLLELIKLEEEFGLKSSEVRELQAIFATLDALQDNEGNA